MEKSKVKLWKTTPFFGFSSPEKRSNPISECVQRHLQAVFQTHTHIYTQSRVRIRFNSFCFAFGALLWARDWFVNVTGNSRMALALGKEISMKAEFGEWMTPSKLNGGEVDKKYFWFKVHYWSNVRKKDLFSSQQSANVNFTALFYYIWIYDFNEIL